LIGKLDLVAGHPHGVAKSHEVPARGNTGEPSAAVGVEHHVQAPIGALGGPFEGGEPRAAIAQDVEGLVVAAAQGAASG
jgi:hypothetical protein